MRGSQTKDQARQTVRRKLHVHCIVAIISLYGDMSFLSCSLTPGRGICIAAPVWRLRSGSRIDTNLHVGRNVFRVEIVESQLPCGPQLQPYFSGR
jgi:hypothetical protein